MFQAIRSIASHPLTSRQLPQAISRYLSWQVSSRLGNPEQVKPWINGLRLLVKRGFHASTACHYFGLPEFESMAFLLHLLRPGDLFVDVGANIGAYSLLAAGVSDANSMAFEPSLAVAEVMENNIVNNNLERKVSLYKIGLGKNHSSAALTIGKGIQNHIVSQSNAVNSQAIKLAPLDDFCQYAIPLLIKIDVEGFETEVVNGAASTLNNPDLKALIIEQVGLGNRFGYNERDLHQKIVSKGFKLFEYEPFKRKLNAGSRSVYGNNLYIRDIDFVNERLNAAQRFIVNGQAL
jgi:FkbM family methyltransferase